MEGQGRGQGGEQPQWSTTNSNAENFYFTSQQLDILYQLWLEHQNAISNHNAALVPNGDNHAIQSAQTSPSMNSQNQTGFLALLNEVDYNANRSGHGEDQRLEGIYSENGQVRSQPPIVRGNVDLVAAAYEVNSNDLVQQMGVGLNLHQSKRAGGPEADQNPPAVDSSKPLLINSGIVGNFSKEDNHHGLQGDNPSNGKRLSCKRRAPESVSRQLLFGSSSNSAEHSEQKDITAQENVVIFGSFNNQANLSNLGQLEAGVVMGAAPAGSHGSSSIVANGSLQGTSINGLGAASSTGIAGIMSQASSWARQSENLPRNIRSRRNANQQDFLPASLATQNTMNSQSVSPSQTAMFFPYDHFVNPSLPSPVQAAPTRPPFLQLPSPRQIVDELSQGDTVPTARGSSSSSALAVNGRDAQRQEVNLINNPGDVYVHPELELGAFSHMGRTINFANGNTNFLRNASPVASSGDGSNGRPPVPTWFPNPIFNEQYSNEVASSLPSLGQNNYFGRPAGDAPPSYFARAAGDAPANYFTIPAGVRREMGNTVGDDINTRPRPRPRRQRLIPRTEREAGGYPNIHPALQFSPPSRRRGRQLLSEQVQNALALVRRNGGGGGGALRFGDYRMMDHSLLFELVASNDAHEDMRLDIDDMTYEELLALGEEIGHVSTGLNEAGILANLRQHKHQSIKDESTDNDEPCCICQEEYADGEDIGKLDCGHEFHVNCIKQWLMLKNLCPICKKTGLGGKRGEH